MSLVSSRIANEWDSCTVFYGNFNLIIISILILILILDALRIS